MSTSKICLVAALANVGLYFFFRSVGVDTSVPIAFGLGWLTVAIIYSFRE